MLTINLEKKFLNQAIVKSKGKPVELTEKDIEAVLNKVEVDFQNKKTLEKDKILKSLGMEKKREQLAQNIMPPGYEYLDATRILHVDKINKICADYKLKFAPTRNFKGDLDEDFFRKVKELNDKTVLYSEDFFIAAHPSMFEEPKRNLDPILFMRLGGSPYYYLVHKWGKDLSRIRYLILKAWLMIPILLAMGISTGIGLYKFIANQMAENSDKFPAHFIGGLVGVAACAVLCFTWDANKDKI